MSATATRLSQALSERNMSQGQLARGIGVTQGAISKILLGHTTNSRHLPRIAAYLGVTTSWLFGYTDDPSVDIRLKPANWQRFSMTVLLPSRPALEAAFLAVLKASPGLSDDELALELSKRLPTILRAAEGATSHPPKDWPGAPAEAEVAPDAEQLLGLLKSHK